MKKMIDYFKNNGFVIMTFSLLILFILEYLLLSKWLIILVGIIGILGGNWNDNLFIKKISPID